MKLTSWGVVLCGILSSTTWAMGYSSEYLNCMNNTQASTAQAALCMKTELKQQTKRYEYFSDIHVKTLSKDKRKEQEKVNKKWLTLRDEHCLIKNVGLSVGHASKYYFCALKKTQAQADMLEKSAYKYR